MMQAIMMQVIITILITIFSTVEIVVLAIVMTVMMIVVVVGNMLVIIGNHIDDHDDVNGEFENPNFRVKDLSCDRVTKPMKKHYLNLAD